MVQGGWVVQGGGQPARQVHSRLHAGREGEGGGTRGGFTASAAVNGKVTVHQMCFVKGVKMDLDGDDTVIKTA